MQKICEENAGGRYFRLIAYNEKAKIKDLFIKERFKYLENGNKNKKNDLRKKIFESGEKKSKLARY